MSDTTSENVTPSKPELPVIPPIPQAPIQVNLNSGDWKTVVGKFIAYAAIALFLAGGSYVSWKAKFDPAVVIKILSGKNISEDNTVPEGGIKVDVDAQGKVKTNEKEKETTSFFDDILNQF